MDSTVTLTVTRGPLVGQNFVFVEPTTCLIGGAGEVAAPIWVGSAVYGERVGVNKESGQIAATTGTRFRRPRHRQFRARKVR